MPVPIRHVRRFHLARVLGWLAFGGLIYAIGLTGSVPVLFWISIAALVESSGTDYVQARTAERENPTAEI